MADKGFRIEDLLKEINVELNTPPFLRKGNFTTEEMKETEEIASLRIHVERRIQRIKSFHIFDRPVSISLAPVVNEMIGRVVHGIRTLDFQNSMRDGLLGVIDKSVRRRSQPWQRWIHHNATAGSLDAVATTTKCSFVVPHCMGLVICRAPPLPVSIWMTIVRSCITTAWCTLKTPG
ncbi:hypothetical protein HPB47_010872 [Ixodes persulcatus]|uniref:Uncharacterized protein n=1 Tax=Ixodes persulcatus TaxID=34615 RepID=A0AC60NXU8_IXOPE|nr:hypothetical protein HPB47_010872 [Ixodes persulcatus]